MASIFVDKVKFIITMNESRRMIRDGAIAIDEDKIVAVGKSRDLRREYGSADRVIDASNMIAVPGLINCHCHTTQQLARGLADNVSLPTWIHDRIYPFEASLKPDEVYISALACFIEAIKTGTTYLADTGGSHMDQVAMAVEKVGIRTVLATSLLDIHSKARPVPDAIRKTTDEAIRSGKDFVRKYDGAADGRLRAWFSLRTERMISNELGRSIKELADEYNVGIESHVSCTMDSVNTHKKIFGGKVPIERYEEAGILGPNLLVIHMNWLTDEELELLRKYNVKVCHCPNSGTIGGHGSLKGGKFVEMMEKGITVALGADTAPCSNFLDMIRVAYMVTAHRDVRLDPTLFPPETILEMLTINGSKALLSENEVGSLETGKKADVTLFDVKRSEWIPLHNPISNLIHSACGHSANTVIIDGKVVMQNRKIETLNESELYEKAQKIAEEVVERAGLKAYAGSLWEHS